MGVSYCATQDVRSFGVPVDQIGDTDLAPLVEVASRIVDNYTGMSSVGFEGLFASTAVKTVVRQDVRTPLLPLFAPCPTVLFLDSPAQPTLNITGAGSQELAYAVVAYNGNDDTIPGPAAYVLNGPTTLDGSHYVTITVPAVTGAVGYRFLRVTGGGSQGIIGTAASPTFNDTGIAATTYVTRYTNNPFLDFASVRVDGRPVAASSIMVDPNYVGLRLYMMGYRDVDGFPRSSQSVIGSGMRGPGGPYGSKVEVNAQFGYGAVPSPVKRATVLVSAYLVARNGETPPPIQLSRLQVEGYMSVYDNRFGVEVLDTTGVIDADRLLGRYRITNALAA